MVTSLAKSKIKSALKKEKKIIANEGKELAQRKLRQLRVKINHQTENELAKFFNCRSSLELYYRFGSGEISNSEIKEYVKLKNSGWYQTIKNKIYGKNKFTPSTKFLGDLIVFNEDDDILEYKIAQCCNPIPGDEIFGFLSVEEGIKVHADQCPNSIELRANYSYRILNAKWTLKENLDFLANIKINGIDSVGLINRITEIISKQMHVNIKAINVVGDDGIFDGEITLKVHNENFLNQVTSKLKKIEGIDEISRTYKHNKNIKI